MQKFGKLVQDVSGNPCFVNIDNIRLIVPSPTSRGNTEIFFAEQHKLTVKGDIEEIMHELHK